MCRAILYTLIFLVFSGCGIRKDKQISTSAQVEQLLEFSLPQGRFSKNNIKFSDISLSKELLYDRYTLSDVYPYRDTVRCIKWETIKKCLSFIDNLDVKSSRWVVLQNYKNMNGEASLVKKFVRNEYSRVADTLGVERYQSVPLYSLSDSVVPVRYGRDGTLCRLIEERGSFYTVHPLTHIDTWLVPARYVKKLSDSLSLNHVIFVDRAYQNIVTVERASRAKWKVRSINPATTGRHVPPFAQETPLGTFVLQQKKEKMLFLKDGSKALGGYAPYACRFTNGAYIHGVPVNVPATKMIEYSWSLGTTPRSHMCVRNATSHSKFVFSWAPVYNSLVVVIE